MWPMCRDFSIASGLVFFLEVKWVITLFIQLLSTKWVLWLLVLVLLLMLLSLCYCVTDMNIYDVYRFWRHIFVEPSSGMAVMIDEAIRWRYSSSSFFLQNYIQHTICIRVKRFRIQFIWQESAYLLFRVFKWPECFCFEMCFNDILTDLMNCIAFDHISNLDITNMRSTPYFRCTLHIQYVSDENNIYIYYRYSVPVSMCSFIGSMFVIGYAVVIQVIISTQYEYLFCCSRSRCNNNNNAIVYAWYT